MPISYSIVSVFSQLIENEPFKLLGEVLAGNGDETAPLRVEPLFGSVVL